MARCNRTASDSAIFYLQTSVNLFQDVAPDTLFCKTSLFVAVQVFEMDTFKTVTRAILRLVAKRNSETVADRNPVPLVAHTAIPGCTADFGF